MRTHHSLLLAFMVLTAAACNKEEPQYYSALGVLAIQADSTIIETDDNERLLVLNRANPGAGYSNRDRVIADFSLAGGVKPAGIDYLVNIERLEKVLFKPVKEITAENSDSVGNDPMAVRNIWLAKDFLNLSFGFYGGNQTHYINLVRQPGELPQDTVELEIRHNDRDDSGYYALRGFVSFDLSSLRSSQADSVIIKVSAKEFDSRTYTGNFTYKY
ncbi:MAG: NigD-like C-terminal domain-containing protein [Bacteroidales bacterium]